MDEQQERSLFLAPAPAPVPQERDEPPAGPAAPLATVEGGRRRRLQIVVVAALLVAGVLVNRSGNERAEEAAVEPGRTTDDDVEAPRPPMLAPSLRTTATSGPLLPELTGTTVVLAAGTQVIVLDVDSGTLRTVQVADLDVSPAYPWGSPVLAVGDAFVVRSQPPRAKIVPRTDGAPVRDLAAGSGGGLHPSTQPGRMWVEEVRGEPVLQEVDLAGTVLRSVPMPRGTASVVWDGAAFVLTAEGTALALAPDGGPATPVGDGLAVAADATTVALLRCEPSDDLCALDLLDRATGAVRTVPPERGLVGFTAGTGTVPVRLSPDGRWLTIQGDAPVEGSAGTGPGLALVDVAAGRVRAVEPGTEAGAPVGAFAPDGRWLFLARTTGSVSARLGGFRLVDGARFDLDVELSVRASFGLALSAVPSTPADLGSGDG